MAQGFKPSKAGTSKGPKGKQRAGPRPGGKLLLYYVTTSQYPCTAKVIAPKKKSAVDAANRKRVSSSLMFVAFSNISLLTETNCRPNAKN